MHPSYIEEIRFAWRVDHYKRLHDCHLSHPFPCDLLQGDDPVVGCFHVVKKRGEQNKSPLATTLLYHFPLTTMASPITVVRDASMPHPFKNAPPSLTAWYSSLVNGLYTTPRTTCEMEEPTGRRGCSISILKQMQSPGHSHRPTHQEIVDGGREECWSDGGEDKQPNKR